MKKKPLKFFPDKPQPLEAQIQADQLQRQNEAAEAVRKLLKEKRVQVAVRAWFVAGVLKTEIQFVAER